MERHTIEGDNRVSDLPRVLLLGDSIRMSYQPIVAKLLDNRAEVVGPEDNCGTSRHTFGAIDDWLAVLGSPHVVHWNNGLHDIGHRPQRDPIQYSLETYLVDLKGILARLRRTGAKIIWATTTPVHPERPFLDTAWSWRSEEIDPYNAAAVRLMQSERVPVNDLHGIVASNLAAYLGDDMVHLSEAGQEACARAVLKAVEALL